MEVDLSTQQYFDESSVNTDLARPARTWTTPLTWICILFILISLTGALGAAYGFYKMNMGPPDASEFRGANGKRMREIQEIREAAVQKYMPLLVYQELMKLALAGAFFFAVTMLIARNAKARSFVLGLCGMALFYHLCATGISLLLLKESGGVMNSIFDEIIADARYQGGITGAEADRARNAMQNAAATSLVIAMSFVLLIKIGFYGSIMAYFWSDDVKKIFGEDPLEYLKKTPGTDPLRSESAMAGLAKHSGLTDPAR